MYLGLPSVLIIMLAASLAATFYGLLALWAVAARVRWYWHITPLALTLTALVPMGGHQPILIFGTQAAGVVLFACAAAGLARWRGWDVDPASLANHWRFSLRDGVLAILLAAVVLTIARSAPPSGESANLIPWWRYAITGLGFCAVTGAAMALVGGRLRWYLRIVLVLVLAGAGEELIALGNLGEAIEPFVFGVGQSPASASDWAGLLATGQMLFTVAWLLLLRLSGWHWWRRKPVRPTEPEPPPAHWAKARLAVRWSSRAALLASSALLVWLVGEVYWELLPPTRFPDVVLPSPNGRDDVVVIDQKLDWRSIPNQDFDIASDADCVRFVEQNAEALDLLRAAVQKQWLCHVDYYDSSTSIDEIQAARSCCRALVVDARRQLALGRPDLAVQDYLDIVQLGILSGQGGLLIDDLVGDAIIGVGIFNLTEKFDRLDPLLQREVATNLDVLDGIREPLAEVLARDELFDKASGGWIGRLAYWAEHVETGPEHWILESATKARKRVDALQRLVMTEAAIRAFQAQHKRLPDDLAELVPEYLSKTPTDPFGDGPLVFRRSDDGGYLLYSVGSNGVDDGGQRATLIDAANSGIGDLFHDASTEVY